MVRDHGSTDTGCEKLRTLFPDQIPFVVADPAALRSSVKDVAENIMIVDLVRNDLGRVARTGSVTVPELLAVRPAPGVWHLVSTVTAQVPTALPNAALLEATFPPASVTGTPKRRARELLTSWEPNRRGIYCGTVGLASPSAGCELNVAIRTVEFAPDGTAVVTRWSGRMHVVDPDLPLARTLRLPRHGDGLFYTGALEGDRVCATLCAGVAIVCREGAGFERW